MDRGASCGASGEGPSPVGSTIERQEAFLSRNDNLRLRLAESRHRCNCSRGKTKLSYPIGRLGFSISRASATVVAASLHAVRRVRARADRLLAEWRHALRRGGARDDMPRRTAPKVERPSGTQSTPRARRASTVAPLLAAASGARDEREPRRGTRSESRLRWVDCGGARVQTYGLDLCDERAKANPRFPWVPCPDGRRDGDASVTPGAPARERRFTPTENSRGTRRLRRSVRCRCNRDATCSRA